MVDGFAQNSKIFNPETDNIWLPINYAVNGTFDVIQNPYWFNQDDYSGKMSEVWNRVKHPHENIKKDGGYKKFFKDEFVSSRVLPNIGLHFLGGAYDTLHLTEYYQHYNYPLPSLWAFITTYFAHFGNEAFETTSEEITSHDHIADIYFFDFAAFLISHNEHFMNFILDDLGLTAWHFNPIYNVKDSNFFNTGLNYVLRPKLLQYKGVRPLAYLGMQNMIGASYSPSKNRTISLAAGLSLTNPLKKKGRFVTALFYEKNDRINSSIFLNGSEDLRYRINLYDNFLRDIFLQNTKKKELWDLAFIFGQEKSRDYLLGLNIAMPFGLGHRL